MQDHTYVLRLLSRMYVITNVVQSCLHVFVGISSLYNRLFVITKRCFFFDTYRNCLELLHSVGWFSVGCVFRYKI